MDSLLGGVEGVTVEEKAAAEEDEEGEEGEEGEEPRKRKARYATCGEILTWLPFGLFIFC